MDKLREWYHAFKMWYCKEEVDYFRKENIRLISQAKMWEEEYFSKVKHFDTLNALDTEIINRLKQEKLDMLFVDPTKIIKTEEVVVDEQGRPTRKKVLTVGGEQLSPDLSQILKQESLYIKKTMWWGLMQNTLTDTAKRTMFENSKDFDDVRTGKSLLYAIDILKKITDRITE